MLTIDGSFGEGGGQILRTSLALSLVTGKPFRIERIRAAREKPGLRSQHLTAVNAAAQVGNAEVRGNEIASAELTFAPRAVTPCKYFSPVGTAGSTSLVLQTVLPALLTASGPSTLVLEGGTHNPMAPPYDYLKEVFLPLLRQMGANVTSRLERYGFFPAGGGRVIVHVQPATLTPIAILQRGKIAERRADAIVSKLAMSIADRELRVIAEELDWPAECLHANKIENSPGPGNVVMIRIQCEHICELFTAFGKKGLPAEKVARQAAREAADYLALDAPVGPHLADQLLIPMALARGRFRTGPLTEHTKTNIEVIRRFLDVAIQVNALPGNIFEIAID